MKLRFWDQQSQSWQRVSLRPGDTVHLTQERRATFDGGELSMRIVTTVEVER